MLDLRSACKNVSEPTDTLELSTIVALESTPTIYWEDIL